MSDLGVLSCAERVVNMSSKLEAAVLVEKNAGNLVGDLRGSSPMDQQAAADAISVGAWREGTAVALVCARCLVPLMALSLIDDRTDGYGIDIAESAKEALAALTLTGEAWVRTQKHAGGVGEAAATDGEKSNADDTGSFNLKARAMRSLATVGCMLSGTNSSSDSQSWISSTRIVYESPVLEPTIQFHSMPHAITVLDLGHRRCLFSTPFLDFAESELFLPLQTGDHRSDKKQIVPRLPSQPKNHYAHERLPSWYCKVLSSIAEYGVEKCLLSGAAALPDMEQPSVLMLGLGGGAVATALLDGGDHDDHPHHPHHPLVSVDAVDNDPLMVTAARAFGFTGEVTVMDALRFLEKFNSPTAATPELTPTPHRTSMTSLVGECENQWGGYQNGEDHLDKKRRCHPDDAVNGTDLDESNVIDDHVSSPHQDLEPQWLLRRYCVILVDLYTRGTNADFILDGRFSRVSAQFASRALRGGGGGGGAPFVFLGVNCGDTSEGCLVAESFRRSAWTKVALLSPSPATAAAASAGGRTEKEVGGRSIEKSSHQPREEVNSVVLAVMAGGSSHVEADLSEAWAQVVSLCLSH